MAFKYITAQHITRICAGANTPQQSTSATSIIATISMFTFGQLFHAADGAHGDFAIDDEIISLLSPTTHDLIITSYAHHRSAGFSGVAPCHGTFRRRREADTTWISSEQ